MALTYKSWLADHLAPPWLRGGDARHLLASLGEFRDDAADAVKLAVLAKLPRAVTPADALGRIGADRLMPRGPAESDASYAARLAGAWESWPWSGTPYGILTALRLAGYGNSPELWTPRGMKHKLDGNNELVTTDAGVPLQVSGSNWWNHYGLVFRRPLPTQWAHAYQFDFAGGTATVYGNIYSGLELRLTYNGGTDNTNLDFGYEVSATPLGNFDMHYYSGGWFPLLDDTSAQIPGAIYFDGALVGGPDEDVTVTVPASSVPADGSDEANFIMGLVRRWAPGHTELTLAAVEDWGEIWGGGTWGGGMWGPGNSITWTP